MLFTLIKFAVSVHEAGWKSIIGNVHPKNIVINEEGKIKVINLNSFPFERDHYETYKNYGIDAAYIR